MEFKLIENFLNLNKIRLNEIKPQFKMTLADLSLN